MGRLTEQKMIESLLDRIEYRNDCYSDVWLTDEEMTLIKKALEKQIAKKPIERIKMIGLDKGGKCPVCQKYVNNHNHWLYCECGQKLDWE